MNGHEETAIGSVLENLSGNTTEPEPSSVTVESTETEKFNFNADYQEQIAALCIGSQTFVRRTHGLIKPEYFESIRHSVLVSISLRHYDKYKVIPKTTAEWADLLKRAKQDRVFREDMQPEIIKEWRNLRGMKDLPSEEYAVDRCAEFARHQSVNQALLSAVDMVQKGKNAEMDKAYRLIRKAFDVGAADAAEPIDYFEQIENRTEQRRALAAGDIKPQGIPTGIRKLDGYLLHKGWGRKELTAFMAGAKQGKSLMLGDLCLRAAQQGYKALYISLELSKDIVALRVDANVADTPITEVEGDFLAVQQRVKAEADKMKGKLYLEEYSPETFKPSMLRRCIERHKANNTYFDVIAVDYADIMAPEVMTKDPIENSKSIWLALRSIAQEENVAMLTATQTNRVGHKATTAKSEDVASDFNKIRSADLVISINADDEELARGEARLYFAASRNQAGNFSLMIKRDLSKGQPMKSVHSTT